LLFFIRHDDAIEALSLYERHSVSEVGQEHDAIREGLIQFGQCENDLIPVACLHDEKECQRCAAQGLSVIHPCLFEDLAERDTFVSGDLAIVVLDQESPSRHGGKITGAQFERSVDLSLHTNRRSRIDRLETCAVRLSFLSQKR
jgi:hypothetical protein